MPKQASVCKIGCFAGFWGDSTLWAASQIAKGNEGHDIDYLVADYLAEVTMCILARSKAKPSKNMGEGGFIDEVAAVIWAQLGPVFMERRIKLVTNAGGMNPRGLKRAIEKVAEKNGARPKVAVVEGDDVLPLYNELAKEGSFTGFSVDGVPEATDPVPPQSAKHLSANAYLGAGAIARALALGADVVITGRVVDSALVLGPLMHEFGWAPEDYDRLAAGSLAGHVIECGAQCCGGNFTDWEFAAAGQSGTPSTFTLFENVGFPIAEVNADGSFVVTKPQGTGGIVSRLSVAEQIIYEIGDPCRYALPDVDADFSNVSVKVVGNNRVHVSGARGNAPSGKYKVTVCTPAGLTMGSYMFGVAGYNATTKAKVIAASVIARAQKILKQNGMPPYQQVLVEVIGSGYLSGNAGESEAREVVLKISAMHKSPRALGILGAQLPSASTGMCQGIFGPIGPVNPSPSPCIKLTSLLLARNKVPITISYGAEESIQSEKFVPPSVQARPRAVLPTVAPKIENYGPTEKAPLITIACCRSGDKGDASNVGVIARREEYYNFLRTHVTAEVVTKFFSHQMARGAKVHRYELPGIAALNFVLSNVLGGGGLMSLKADKQAKTQGTLFLSLQLDIPSAWVKRYNDEEKKQKQSILEKLSKL